MVQPPPITPDRREHTIVERDKGTERRQKIVEDLAAERWEQAVRVSEVIWLIIGIVEILVGLRVLLRLIAANPENNFASFIYRVTSGLIAPFVGLTGTPSFDGSVLEVSSLIAMLVFGLIGWVAVRIVFIIYVHIGARRISTYERYQHDEHKV